MNFGGVALMVASVSFVALGSIFAKLLLGDMPASQVLWLRFAGFCVVMAPITLILHRRETLRPHVPTRQIVRGLLGVAVAYCLILAIRDIGVSQALAAFYVYPAVSYAIGIVWLNERSSPMKWAAVGVGFVGVTIVIDPNLSVTGAGLAYAVAAAVLASVRVAMHRHDSNASTPMVTALWDRGVGAILATSTLAVGWSPIDPGAIYVVIGLILSSVAAQLLFVYAIARAPLGVLAPFTFWEVVFVILLDVLVLDAAPSLQTALGVMLIVAAGLLLTARRGAK